jgi:hypothetical protein
MRSVNSSHTVVLGVVIGAAVTWLWVSRGGVPTARSTVEPQRVAPPTSRTLRLSVPPTEVHTRESSGVANKAGPAVSARPSLGDASRVARDDSTYLRMLELAASRSDAAEATRKISEMHERFVLTPDDPDWGRRSEQALRDFFHSRSANKSRGIEITSVSCRSAGCEVQAKIQMAQEFGEPQSAAGGPETAAGQESAGADPRTAIQETWPVGQSLKQEDYIGSEVGDSVGFIVWYQRVGTSPGPQSSSAQ